MESSDSMNLISTILVIVQFQSSINFLWNLILKSTLNFPNVRNKTWDNHRCKPPWFLFKIWLHILNVMLVSSDQNESFLANNEVLTFQLIEKKTFKHHWVNWHTGIALVTSWVSSKPTDHFIDRWMRATIAVLIAEEGDKAQ